MKREEKRFVARPEPAAVREAPGELGEVQLVGEDRRRHVPAGLEPVVDRRDAEDDAEGEGPAQERVERGSQRRLESSPAGRRRSADRQRSRRISRAELAPGVGLGA